MRQFYDNVRMAFWVLVAAAVVFLLLQIPRMREARAIAEAQQVLEISEQNRFYCEKWGMRAGTHEHVICTMDLGEIRKEVEQRIAAENDY
jgi:hypothetical protein